MAIARTMVDVADILPVAVVLGITGTTECLIAEQSQYGVENGASSTKNKCHPDVLCEYPSHGFDKIAN
jgi:hypothetical protein